MPANYTMNLYRGDTYHFQFVFWDDPAKTQPSDLTGVVAKSEIRDKPSGKIVIELTMGISLNVVTADLAAADSNKLPLPTGAWDLQLTYPNGDVVTPIAGVVIVTADVTDSISPAPFELEQAERKAEFETWRKQATAKAS